MRHSKLFALMLLLVTTISLTACNSTKPTIESTISVETTTSEVQTAEIYLQEDGTYYISDDLLQEFRKYSIFNDWQGEEFEPAIQRFVKHYYPEAQNIESLLTIAENLSLEIDKVREQTKQYAQQNQEKANPKGYHLIKDAEGDVVCTPELREAIHLSLSKAGLEINYRQEILNRYYEATLEMDNTEIHNDIIDNITSSLKKEIEVQQSVTDEKKEQNNKKEEIQQQKPSGDNVQVDDNGYVYEDNNEYPSGNIYEEEGPRLDDPTAGLEEKEWTASNEAGDGGDLVTDIVVKPAGE